MSPLLSLNRDTTSHVFSFLSKSDILNCRRVSKETKRKTEEAEQFKEIKKIIERVHLQVKSAIQIGKDACFLYSNKKAIKALSSDASTLWTLNTEGVFQKNVFSFPKVDSWKRVFWNKSEVAIHKPKLPISISDVIKLFSTEIYDTQNGDLLGRCFDSPLFPLCWCKSGLLSKESFARSSCTLFSWDVWNHSKPKKILDTAQGEARSKYVREAHSSENGDVYCFVEVARSFQKLDIAAQTLCPLEYTVGNYGQQIKIKNFGVTAVGNIFFSEDKSVFLINGDSAHLMAKIEAPIAPQQISFQFPFISFFQESRFMIYDIRKPETALCDYDYLTLRKRIEINSHIYHWEPDNSPYDDIKIDSLLFHNSDLYVRRIKGTLDRFQLNSGFSLLNYFYWF